MNDETNYTKCPKCGFKLKSTDRFCIHCGYINFDNNKNEFLETYDKNAKKLGEKKEEKKPEDNIEDTGKLSLTDYKMKTVEDNTKDKNKIEGAFIKFNYKAVRIGIVIVVFIVLLLLYSYIKDKQDVYVEDAKKIVDVIKKQYESSDACKGDGTHYFKFMYSDLENRYGLKIKSIYHNMEYFGYVKVVRKGNDVKYYVSINDGRFGIREKEVSKLSPLCVLPYDSNYDSIKDSSC